MTDSLYIVQHGGTKHLVKAKSTSAARAIIAQAALTVRKPSAIEMYEMGRAGVGFIDEAQAPIRAKRQRKPVTEQQLEHLARARAAMKAKREAAAAEAQS